MDLKKNTKARLVNVKKHQSATGGGPPISEPTDTEKHLLEIISPVSVDGNDEIRESEVTFKFDVAECIEKGVILATTHEEVNKCVLKTNKTF